MWVTTNSTHWHSQSYLDFTEINVGSHFFSCLITVFLLVWSTSIPRSISTKSNWTCKPLSNKTVIEDINMYTDISSLSLSLWFLFLRFIRQYNQLVEVSIKYIHCVSSIFIFYQKQSNEWHDQDRSLWPCTSASAQSCQKINRKVSLKKPYYRQSS